MAAPAFYAPASAVATLEDIQQPSTAHKKAVVQLDASAALYRQLIGSMIPAISQMVRRMTLDWPNDVLVNNLKGKEVSAETYDLINRYGGLLPPPETKYGCIFFTFTLRKQEHADRGRLAHVPSSSLFIEDVQLVQYP